MVGMTYKFYNSQPDFWWFNYSRWQRNVNNTSYITSYTNNNISPAQHHIKEETSGSQHSVKPMMDDFTDVYVCHTKYRCLCMSDKTN